MGIIRHDKLNPKTARKLPGKALEKPMEHAAELLDIHDIRTLREKKRRRRITQKLIDYANSLGW